ncbi:MAG TPA: transcription antitermination factor NusB [Bacteroidales bacterium]|nr:transcription antitermination factor NusB [Bacteroidales bacterium]
MISRRLLRIKALLIFYAFNRKRGDNLEAAEKELIYSIEKTYDLYHYMILLILEIADIASEKIEIGRNKKIPTFKDINPNTKFTDNRLIAQLRENLDLRRHIKSRRLSWISYPEIARKIYSQMIEWAEYEKYMIAEKVTYNADKKFVSSLLTEIIYPSEDIENVIEEISIYWNDDLEFVIAMIEKTIRRFRENSGPNHSLMPMYKNEDDKRFVKILLRKAILNTEPNSSLIENSTTNWEIERIALMDKLVMQLAITEILEFPEIPVKVTLNEYIEIAKYYCTAKSGTFVNGILDKIVRELRAGSMFKKSGRGLIGEPGFEEIK